MNAQKELESVREEFLHVVTELKAKTEKLNTIRRAVGEIEYERLTTWEKR